MWNKKFFTSHMLDFFFFGKYIFSDEVPLFNFLKIKFALFQEAKFQEILRWKKKSQVSLKFFFFLLFVYMRKQNFSGTIFLKTKLMIEIEKKKVFFNTLENPLSQMRFLIFFFVERFRKFFFLTTHFFYLILMAYIRKKNQSCILIINTITDHYW